MVSYIGYVNHEVKATSAPMTIRIKEDTPRTLRRWLLLVTVQKGKLDGCHAGGEQREIVGCH